MILLHKLPEASLIPQRQCMLDLTEWSEKFQKMKQLPQGIQMNQLQGLSIHKNISSSVKKMASSSISIKSVSESKLTTVRFWATLCMKVRNLWTKTNKLRCVKSSWGKEKYWKRRSKNFKKRSVNKIKLSRLLWSS